MVKRIGRYITNAGVTTKEGDKEKEKIGAQPSGVD